MDNINNDCFTCFPTNGKILCVSGDQEKVVRQFMHPTDDIKWTLWIFEAKIKCFNKNSLQQQKNILQDFSHPNYKFTHIEFDKTE